MSNDDRLAIETRLSVVKNNDSFGFFKLLCWPLLNGFPLFFSGLSLAGLMALLFGLIETKGGYNFGVGMLAFSVMPSLWLIVLLIFVRSVLGDNRPGTAEELKKVCSKYLELRKCSNPSNQLISFIDCIIDSGKLGAISRNQIDVLNQALDIELEQARLKAVVDGVKLSIITLNPSQ